MKIKNLIKALFISTNKDKTSLDFKEVIPITKKDIPKKLEK